MALLPLVLLASTQGAAVGILLILVGRSQPGPAPPPAPAAPAADRGAGEGADEEAWVPPRHALPFGPFLVAGALEWLWFSEPLVRLVPLLEVFR